ncbi:MAG: murein biosynthesis integral membrane protein MurJ [Candidatus Sungbacteria bacterium]|nr:murein biosynthesis integral membrane protein MurJ [bacterium]MDZ4260059.1 murein biosynthesis integral membrane protein MurJ [Candidatus Sungbacteria bacterium]
MIQKIFTFNGAISSVHAAAFLIGSAGLISRLLGILRNRLLASHFGAGRELDIYYAAFQIPDFMSAIFLLGAGSAAILPVFQEYLKNNKSRAHDLISNLQSGFLFASGIVGILIFFLAPLFLQITVPGFSDSERELTVLLTRIMLLSPIFLGLSSILSSVVQSFQRFFAYALAPIFYNVGIIAGIIFFVPLFGVMGLGMGVALGACLHWIIQLISISQIGFRPRLIIPRVNEGFKKVLRLSFPRVLSLSLTQLTLIMLMALGSTLHAGSIAVFELSQDLYFVPVALFGISYSVAIFPRLTHAYFERDAGLFFRELFFGMRTIIFWIVPTIALFIVLRAHIVRVTLGAGRFSWEDTRLTAASLAALSFAMLAGSLTPLLIKAFYALEKTWAPLFINIIAGAVSIICAVIFTHLLGQESAFSGALLGLFRITDLSSARVLGLSLGFTVGLLVDNVLLWVALRRAMQARFGIIQTFPLRPIIHICIAACAAGLSAYGVRISFSQTLPLITFARVLMQGILSGAVGFAIYIGVLMLFKSEDVETLRRSLHKRLISLRVLPKSWDGDIKIE